MAALPTLSYMDFRAGTIIGDAIYWVLKFKHIFGYNMETHAMYYIEYPAELNYILKEFSWY